MRAVRLGVIGMMCLLAHIGVAAGQDHEARRSAMAAAFASSAQAPRPAPRVPFPRLPRGQRQSDWPEATALFEKTLRLRRNGTIDVQNIAGSVTITGGGGDEVRLAAIKRVRAPEDSTRQALLDELDIQMEERAGNVEVRTLQPRQRQSSAAVDYTITIPREATVTVKTISSDVAVSNINGELQVGTISGSVTVRDLEARSIQLQSVSGDLQLLDVHATRAAMKSISGDIEYSGPLARNGRYEFQSHSGDVRISPSTDTGFTIEARTFSGDVRSDYALALERPSNPRGRRNSFIRGSFGDAAATLILQSFSGDISVVRR